MKRYLTASLAIGGLLVLVSAAAAQMGPGWGRGGMMGGGPGVNCPFATSETAEQITEEKAKELAQQYADKYLAGFKVERVLPFTGRLHTMYSVELKNDKGELRTLRVTPFGGIGPMGPRWGRRA
jgi:hypothetical protein